MYGGYVSNYNNVEDTVMSMVNAAFLQEGVFDQYNCIKQVTYEQVCARFDEVFDVNNSALSVVWGKQEAR